MRYILIISLSLVITSTIFAINYAKSEVETVSETGIQFYNGTFNEAMALAKKENKLIFLDIYASWCGPCKRLKSKTFSNKEVGDYYNKYFINVALDGEKGEGIEISKKYGVTAYPTLLFIDGNGKIISNNTGFHNPTEFLTLGKSILNK